MRRAVVMLVRNETRIIIACVPVSWGVFYFVCNICFVVFRSYSIQIVHYSDAQILLGIRIADKLYTIQVTI